MEADAPMRGRPAEMRDLVAAMDSVALIKKYRIGHRWPIVFAREPFARQPLRPVAAIRRAVAPARGRHWPSVAAGAVNLDGEALRRFVDGHYDIGSRRREWKQKCGGGEGNSGARQGYLPSPGWRNLINLDKYILIEASGSLRWSVKWGLAIVRSSLVN